MKSPIYLVDEEDNITGESQSRDVDLEHDIYRTTGVWILNSQGQALIAQRKFTKRKDPGLWGPSVAGTVEVGETYDQNAQKELEEEVGVASDKLIPIQKIRVASPQNYFCQYYAVRIDWPLAQFTPQEEEVEKLEWIDIDKLSKDIQDHPEKYIKSMPQSLEVLKRAEENI